VWNIKQLPNAITSLRILLSITLLFLLRQPLAFVTVYVLCGISDVVDGFLARHLKLETALGAKLDSSADFIFFAVSLFAFFTLVRIENPVLLIVIVALIAAIRVANFLLTKKKFSQWAVMHTVGNKATGLLLFVFIPVCVWLNSAPLWLLFAVGIIGLLSALEELVILLTTKRYEVNRKSVFTTPSVPALRGQPSSPYPQAPRD
jgi:CDP-diacylglycerol--glycerol-3-phosphate 3-phosphatidyltransferase